MVESEQKHQYIDFIINVYCPYHLGTRRDIATREGAVV
jgi:hypothetical protein